MVLDSLALTNSTAPAIRASTSPRSQRSWRAINKRRALLQWLGRTLLTRCNACKALIASRGRCPLMTPNDTSRLPIDALQQDHSSLDGLHSGRSGYRAPRTAAYQGFGG